MGIWFGCGTGRAPYTLAREADPKERLSVRVQAEGEVALQILLARWT